MAEEQNHLCTVVPLSGTFKGRVAVGRPEGAAGGRGAGAVVKAGLRGLGGEQWWAEEPALKAQRR